MRSTVKTNQAPAAIGPYSQAILKNDTLYCSGQIAIDPESGAMMTDSLEAGWAEANALKRLGDPVEFAATATFLVGKPAAYITGIGMVVDGGRVKHIV